MTNKTFYICLYIDFRHISHHFPSHSLLWPSKNSSSKSCGLSNPGFYTWHSVWNTTVYSQPPPLTYILWASPTCSCGKEPYLLYSPLVTHCLGHHFITYQIDRWMNVFLSYWRINSCLVFNLFFFKFFISIGNKNNSLLRKGPTISEHIIDINFHKIRALLAK